MENLVIYKIDNLVTGEAYIGCTTRGMTLRKYEHNYKARAGIRTSRLYTAMRKYGLEQFEFTALFHVFNKRDLLEYEAHFINEYNTFHKGYNMSIGTLVSAETRAKLSKALKGREMTWAAKIVASRKRNKQAKLALGV